MNIRDDILKEIKKNGILWTNPSTPEVVFVELDKLVEEGVLTTADKEGLRLLNEGWCYLEVGNPQKIRVVSKDNYSWFEKPKKKKGD